MPRKWRRVKAKRADLSEVTRMQRIALDRGCVYFPRDPELQPDVLAEVWRIHRDALLAEWITAKPGTRPWAWWEYDAPEPRRRLSGPPAPEKWKELSRGIPRIYVPGAEYEEESDYLARHGLLSRAERDALAD